MLIKIEIKYDLQVRVVAAKNQTKSGYNKRFRNLDLQGRITRGYTSYDLIYYFLRVDVPLVSILWNHIELEGAFSDDVSDLVTGHVGGNIFALELNVSV